MRFEIRLIEKCLYLTKFQSFQRTFIIFNGTAMVSKIKYIKFKHRTNTFYQSQLSISNRDKRNPISFLQVQIICKILSLPHAYRYYKC